MRYLRSCFFGRIGCGNLTAFLRLAKEEHVVNVALGRTKEAARREDVDRRRSVVNTKLSSMRRKDELLLLHKNNTGNFDDTKFCSLELHEH